MEPLRPDFRAALKEAHPGLTDEIIDEYEKLTALRYQLDVERYRESVQEIDRQREDLLRTRMPQFAQVAQLVAARRKARRPQPEAGYKVEILPDPAKKSGR